MVEILVHQFVPKTSAKKLLESKRNRSQNNPLENNVKRGPAKSSRFSTWIESSQYFLPNGCNHKAVENLYIFEKILCTRRKFGFNKKICTKSTFPPQQQKWHTHTMVLYTKYVRNTKNYFPPDNTTPQMYCTLST